MKNIAIATLIISAIISGAATAGIATAHDLAEAERLELVQRKSKHFDLAFNGDTSEVRELKKIYIDDLDMANVKVDQPDSYRLSSNGDWELTEKDKIGLNNIYKSALRKRIEKQGNYSVVDAPGSDVITIQADLLELDPAAPKDDFKNRAPRDKYLSYGAGSATIQFTVSDQNGDVLLIAKDHRDAGHEWGINDRFQNKSDTKRLFNSWAKSLVKQLNLHES